MIKYLQRRPGLKKLRSPKLQAHDTATTCESAERRRLVINFVCDRDDQLSFFSLMSDCEIRLTAWDKVLYCTLGQNFRQWNRKGYHEVVVWHCQNITYYYSINNSNNRTLLLYRTLLYRTLAFKFSINCNAPTLVQPANTVPKRFRCNSPLQSAWKRIRLSLLSYDYK